MNRRNLAISAHHARQGRSPGGVGIATGKLCNAPNASGTVTGSFPFTESSIGLGNTLSPPGCARLESKSISDMVDNHVLRGTMEGQWNMARRKMTMTVGKMKVRAFR